MEAAGLDDADLLTSYYRLTGKRRFFGARKSFRVFAQSSARARDEGIVFAENLSDSEYEDDLPAESHGADIDTDSDDYRRFTWWKVPSSDDCGSAFEEELEKEAADYDVEAAAIFEREARELTGYDGKDASVRGECERLWEAEVRELEMCAPDDDEDYFLQLMH